MPSPFEDDSREYVALCNEEEQYSLWPKGNAVPDGWRVVYGPDSRQKVMDHVDRVWTDMRPRSLRDAGAGHGGAPA
ncbi:MbtH family protein [Streptomyces californicus]|uniref:MbtH family protein n=1 Tax=Streptomyces californicus TaxID=67351 RepID=UPI0037A671B4